MRSDYEVSKMRMYDIIEKKKKKQELTNDEIQFFINGVTDKSIPDYQISALLMAIYFNGMTDSETLCLTLAMARSGDMVDLSKIDGKTVDKHSTGGVGDKTTLIVAPVVSALGGKIAKMSGRGLGHTGGTLDKLESIPGFSVTLSPDDFINQVNEKGIAVIAQSGNMVPADKALYALRDVTATVDSIPLIASSVMSKKIASGAEHIVLDVKYGSGAFMKTKEAAEILAEKMVEIGNNAGRKCAAIITSMDSPLGRAVGNSLEVKEAIDILNGKGPDDLYEICITISALMYSLMSGYEIDKCKSLVKDTINNKSALNKFKEMVLSQGGDVKVTDNTDCFKIAKNKVEFKAKRDGYIFKTDAEKIGIAAMILGAGRMTKDDIIDMSAGLILNKKTGDFVNKGDVIATIYSNKDATNALGLLDEAILISDEKPEKEPLIYKIIKR